MLGQLLLPLGLGNYRASVLFAGLIMGVGTAGMVGCAPEPEIRVYKVDKSDVNRAVASVQSEKIEQQMVGYIVPHKGSAWFFKLMEEPDKVAQSEPQFREIVESLEFAADGAPIWKLPEGWEDQIVRSITYAKIVNTNNDLTATVTQLPDETEDSQIWEDSVWRNVNRWRGQLSLANADWQSMQADLEEVPSLSQNEVKAYYVNLRGTKSAGGGPPFMGMGGGAPFANPPGQVAAAGGVKEPKDDVTVEPTPPTSPAVPAQDLKYKSPEGWVEIPSSGIRKAAFEISEGDQTAEVSVSTAGGDAEMLVGMWMDQLAAEKSPEAIEKTLADAKEMDVNGVASTLFRIDGDAKKSILVARVPWNEREALFVKMTGPSELVTNQSEALEAFLGSLSW